MSNITYTTLEVSDIDVGVNQVRVMYTNDTGFFCEREIYVPRKEDGSVDEDLYHETLENHRKSIEYKIKVGAIKCTTLTPEEIALKEKLESGE